MKKLLLSLAVVAMIAAVGCGNKAAEEQRVKDSIAKADSMHKADSVKAAEAAAAEIQKAKADSAAKADSIAKAGEKKGGKKK